MSDPTIPAQLCDDRTTHESHQWLDSDKGNPANHTWWCPGLSYTRLEEDDEISEAAAQILKEYKTKVVDRIQAMQEALMAANNEWNRLGRQIHKLDDSLVALRMELEDE